MAVSPGRRGVADLAEEEDGAEDVDERERPACAADGRRRLRRWKQRQRLSHAGSG